MKKAYGVSDSEDSEADLKPAAADNKAKAVDNNGEDYDSDNAKIPVSSPPRDAQFTVHGRTRHGDETVQIGSVVPGVKKSLSKTPKGQNKDVQSPDSAKRQMAKIDEELRAIPPKFGLDSF